jgi:hypothetical protein
MSLLGYQCLLSVTVADSVHIQQMAFSHTNKSYCSWNKTSDTLCQLIARYNLSVDLQGTYLCSLYYFSIQVIVMFCAFNFTIIYSC